MGEKQPNDFGLHDIHGNVWEWCADVVDYEFYSKREATKKDPICTSGSEERIVRGGTWKGLAEYCRSARRTGGEPSAREDNLGFRPSAPVP